MWYADAFASLIASLLFLAAFLAWHGWLRADATRPYLSRGYLFAILFLSTWAGGVWLRPFGPMFLGALWMPFLVMAFFVVLILAAVVPMRPRYEIGETVEEAEDETHTDEELGAAFWALFVAFCMVLIVRYLYFLE